MTDIIHIVLEIIGVLFLCYVAFFKSYFSEKGKNVATKEDIEEITMKVEAIKNEFSLFSQSKADYLKDRKESALDFLESISIWIDYSMKPMDLIFNNLTNIVVLSNLISDLRVQASKATTNYWKLYTYFEEDIVHDSSANVYNKCIELNNITLRFLVVLEKHAKMIKHYEDILTKVKDRDEIIKKRETLIKVINAIQDEYYQEKEQIENDVILCRLDFTIMLSQVLKIKTPTN